MIQRGQPKKADTFEGNVQPGTYRKRTGKLYAAASFRKGLARNTKVILEIYYGPERGR